MTFKQESKLAQAIFKATWAHDGQVDKAGEPYILHCLRVMLAMKTETERIAAVLHDILEDTEETPNDIISAFGVDIYAIVETLTRREGEEYFDYIKRIKPHPTAKAIKLADLADNMNPARMKLNLTEDHERLLRYTKAIKILMEVRKSREL